MQHMKLESGWLAAHSGEVQWTGVELTTTHPPSEPTKPWMDAVVPGTVLTTLLKNKMIPDPFYGLENEKIIDIADVGRDYYTLWFFTKFNLSMSKNARAWLQFRGINYQAEIFLNGKEELLPKGMFRRHILDITGWINTTGPNFLAVLVHPPDHPGRIPPEGGQGGDHQIGQDVATQYVEGWDWMIPIRDRNTGIWDEVSISVTGPVKISDPHLVGSFFDGFKRVYLHSSIELENTSSQPADCVLRLQVGTELEGDTYLIEHLKEQEVTIPGGSTILHTFPPLFFYKPQLWWPNGMGKQALYKVDITVEVLGYGESDSWSHPFGFRKIESHIDPSTGGRLFVVNGEPLFIRGGNWIVSDGLLRLSEKRYKSDIDFHADMNFNMIRCWGGGIAERPEFYQNCDQRGLLVWQEFWITGDNDGRSVTPTSDPNWPLDHKLFMTCAKDTIKLLRNYASLALWVGGNEQHPADDLNTDLMNDLKLHPFFELSGTLDISEPNKAFVDPSRYLDGTRIYIQGSLWDGFARGNGDFTDGPYEIQYPENFFKDDFYSYGFNPEVGSVGTPVAATIRATMPAEAWQPPQLVRQPNGYIEELPNPTWKYHTYIPYSNPGKVHDQIELYGEPIDLDDFCRKAQLVNYMQYRALMEGWTSRMWTKYTGVLIWKNLNPWTGLRGQFYDHLHDQTGGFFGVRSACEPIHVQLNLLTYFIEVVNTTAASLNDVTLEATVWDLDGACPYHQVVQHLKIPKKKTLPVIELQYPKSKNKKPVYFLLLKIFDRFDTTVISRNFYWLHLSGGNYKPLEGTFKYREIPLRINMKSLFTANVCKVFVQIENLSTSGRIGTQTCQKGGNKDLAEYMTSNQRKEAKNYHFFLSRGSSATSSVKEKTPSSKLQCVEVVNLSVYSGVAFWLHFSVLSANRSLRPGDDRRILPVSYSENYFSLTPGEKIDVEISFENPEGIVPNLVLQGWNIKDIQLPLPSS